MANGIPGPFRDHSNSFAWPFERLLRMIRPRPIRCCVRLHPLNRGVRKVTVAEFAENALDHSPIMAHWKLNDRSVRVLVQSGAVVWVGDGAVGSGISALKAGRRCLSVDSLVTAAIPCRGAVLAEPFPWTVAQGVSLLTKLATHCLSAEMSTIAARSVLARSPIDTKLAVIPGSAPRATPRCAARDLSAA